MKKSILISSILGIMSLAMYTCKDKPAPAPDKPVVIISPNGYTITGTNTVYGTNFTLLTSSTWRARLQFQYLNDALTKRSYYGDDESSKVTLNFNTNATMNYYPENTATGFTNFMWFFEENESKLSWKYLSAGTTEVKVQNSLVNLQADSLVIKRYFIVGSDTKITETHYFKF